jgi:hypothetical protein
MKKAQPHLMIAGTAMSHVCSTAQLNHQPATVLCTAPVHTCLALVSSQVLSKAVKVPLRCYKEALSWLVDTGTAHGPVNVRAAPELMNRLNSVQ